MENTVIELNDVSFQYNQKPVLQNVCGSFQGGTLYALLGPNGSGKSTLLNLIGGLTTPRQGTISLNREPLASYRRRTLARTISYVPQDYSVRFPYTVYETVLMGRYPFKPAFQDYSSRDHELTGHALKVCELWDLAEKPITAISGGEKQRVAIARSLNQNTPVILLDEPFSNIDIKYTLELIGLFRALAQQGRLIVIALHDLSLALQFTDQAVYLHELGMLVPQNREEAFHPSTIRTVYGVDTVILQNPLGRPVLSYSWEHRTSQEISLFNEQSVSKESPPSARRSGRTG